jgi:hypothetical protein
MARGDVLYVVNGSSLQIVNTTNRTATRYGSLGSYRVGGLAVRSDGKLFGASSLANQLVSIDVNYSARTAAVTPVGTLDSAITLSTDIAFDPLSASDALYGVQDFDPNTVLFSIDTRTARTTKTVDLETGGIVGLAFDNMGQLWGIDGRFDTHEELVKINKETGEIQVMAANGLKEFANIGGLAIGPTGSFWALNSDDTQVYLLSIDRMTGKATNLGAVQGLRGDLGVFGVAAAIPEPATLVIAMLGALTLPTLRRRRVRRSHVGPKIRDHASGRPQMVAVASSMLLPAGSRM